jgi:hypothetical protein
VRGPSQEVRFVARGRVLDHLGEFIARMKEAGSSAELYRRAPVPPELLRIYLKDDPHEQKETEEPADPPPNLGEVNLRDTVTTQSLSATTNLWTGVSSFTVTDRKVVVLQIPNLTEHLAFGLAKVNHTEYLWAVAFVARVATSQPTFNDESGKALPVSSTNPPTTLVNYMNTRFGGSQLAGMNVPGESTRTSGQSYTTAVA